jgi:F0F1-type ATP synthase membrane subunit b/b'
MLNNLSTSTPASEVSSADFARNDGQYSAELEASRLDDIMRDSPVAKLLGLNKESLPKEGDDVPTPDDSSDEDTPSENDDDSVTDPDAEDNQDDDSDNPAEDDTSTQNADLPTEEDIDWEYKVPVTVDGKTEYVTLEEIRKGYSTDQHLSQKGRELGELKKQVELERSTKLQELVELGSILNENLTSVESDLQKKYHKLSADIDKARDDGDTYTARELKEERESVQEQYWKARNEREQKTQVIAEKWQEQQQEQQKQMLETFKADIVKAVPDFSEKVAKSIRDFAIQEGIPEQLLDVIYDANVVKFINDYRKLKTAQRSGEMKRKQVTTVKSVPSRKGTPQSQRDKAAVQNNREKVLSGNGDTRDQLDFLKRVSSISRKL